MNTRSTGIIVSAEDSIPTELIDEFTANVQKAGLEVQTETRESEPSAGMDWLLPTALIIFFGAFLKEAGQDAYRGVKAALRRLVESLRQANTTTIVSSPEKTSSEPPGPLTIAIEDDSANALRFVFPSDPEHQAMALEAFIHVLDDNAHRAALMEQYARAQEEGFATWKVIARFDTTSREWTVEAPLSGKSWPIR